MSIIINNPETEKLISELTLLTGETVDELLIKVLNDFKKQKRKTKRPNKDRLLEIAKHCASLSVYENGTPDEIMDYIESAI